MLHDLLTFFAHTYASVFGITAGPPLHDPLAVAVLLSHLNPSNPSPTLSFTSHEPHQPAPELFTVTVTTVGKHSVLERESGEVGRTVARKLPPGQVGVRIPRGVDVGAFWGVLEGCMQAAEAAVEGKRR